MRSSSLSPGSGLPDRDYYLRNPSRTRKPNIVTTSRACSHGRWPQAQTHADTIVALETQIAGGQLEPSRKPQPRQDHNPMTLADLTRTRPAFRGRHGWRQPGGRGFSRCRSPNNRFPKLAMIFADATVETMQAWHAFHIVDQAAPFLSKRFEEAGFAFRSGRWPASLKFESVGSVPHNWSTPLSETGWARNMSPVTFRRSPRPRWRK